MWMVYICSSWYGIAFYLLLLHCHFFFFPHIHKYKIQFSLCSAFVLEFAFLYGNPFGFVMVLHLQRHILRVWVTFFKEKKKRQNNWKKKIGKGKFSTCPCYHRTRKSQVLLKRCSGSNIAFWWLLLLSSLSSSAWNRETKQKTRNFQSWEETIKSFCQRTYIIIRYM